MKKRILVTIAMLGLLIPMTASAASLPMGVAEVVVSVNKETFENGDTLTTVVTEECGGISLFATTYSKTGSKTSTYTNSSGTVLWTYKLTGTFNVNSGVSATCTAASDSVSINNSSWEKISSSTSKSGNTATGNVSMRLYVLGLPQQSISRTITLKCSNTGTLS